MNDIERVYQTFFNPGEIAEIRGIGFYREGPWIGFARGTVSGYFDNAQDFAKAAGELDRVKSEQDRNIYFILNPCKPELLARAHNRLKVPKATTSDGDILCCRWLLVDADFKRPSGISATDEQVKAALECRDNIASWFISQGWPDPILAQSGNGGHSLYRLPDLPNTEESKQIIKKILKTINTRFGQNGVVIDQSVYSPAQPCKLYGTVAQKGDCVGPYKHRRSSFEVGRYPASTY